MRLIWVPAFAAAGNSKSKLQMKRMAAVLFCALLIGAVTAVAQDIVGRISGTVTDPQGASVPGATITITNEATGISIVPLTTDQAGFFAADELPVGNYTVSAEAKGFRKTSVSGAHVTAGGRMTVNLTVEVGEVSEMVTVQAEAETTNTTSGELSTTVSQEQVASLPLNQRHYESVVGLMPGAALQGSGMNAAAFTNGYNTAVANVNGQREDGQNWSVDGGWNLDSGSNGSVFNQVGADFIQEVDVQSSNYDAEFGRSDSSTVNVITKSGTAQYHGGGFEFVQNNVFNAENAGTKLTTPTARGYTAVPPFHLNDFGWQLGGPIPYIQPKGKLFFFAGEEWKRFRGSAPGLANSTARETFPTVAEMSGNFADVDTGSTPLVLQTPAYIPPSCGGVLYTATNVINPACITGDAKAIQALYTNAAKLSTLGGLPTATTANNMVFNLANPANIREDIIRVDEHPNASNSLYFRYIHDSVDIVNPYSTFGATGVPVDPDERNRPGNNYQIGWTVTISPNLINEAKFNADWHKQTTPVQGTAWLKTTYGFQFIPPLGNPAQFTQGLPQIGFSSSGNATHFPTAAPTGVDGPATAFLESPTADISPADNVTWQVHNHTIKFGGLFARNRKLQNSRTAYTGSLNFSNTAGNAGSDSTGDAFADALLGNFNSLSQSSAVTIGQFRFNDAEAYVQDTWKVTRKLSLVLGVRYAYETPTYAQGNNMTNFDPYAFNPGLDPTFTTVGSSSTISPTTPPGPGGAPTPGLCSGPLLNVVGAPLYAIECNGLERPGDVPFDQAGRVPATYTDPQLLAAIPPTAPRGFYNPENLWAPRFGFSFAPFNDNTVIRGGFGVFYDHPEGNVLGNGINSQGYPPWAESVTISGSANASDNLGTYDAAPGAASVPALTTFGLNGLNPHLVVARSYQYSLSVQRQLPRDVLLQVAYVGNQGRHILRAPGINAAFWTPQNYVPVSPNPNTEGCPAGINGGAYHCSAAGFAPASLSKDQLNPYLGYSGIQMATSDVDSNYNALQISLTKRAGILTASVAYTYSKALGDDGGAGDAYNQNPESECPFTCLISTAYQTGTNTYAPGSNPVEVNGGFLPAAGGTQTGGVVKSWKQYDYARLSYDTPNILAVSFTVEQPFGKGMTGWMGGVVKGWSLSAVTHYQNGYPSTANGSVNLGLNGSGVSRRGVYISGQSIRFSGSCTTANVICYLNPNAFELPTELAAGNEPLQMIIGPPYRQWDMSLRKAFPMREGMSLQFQADAFNVFNQTNWNGPSTTIGSSSYGQITGSLPARVLQFGGKFNF